MANKPRADSPQRGGESPDERKKTYKIANPSVVEEFCARYGNKRAVVLEALKEICSDPLSQPPAVTHLKAQYHCNRRKRFGDFRIRYEFDPDQRLINLLEIGPRSSAY
jgi:mRNA-degrading endonuclease RelE of RelBE toxin-antitoxin system